jgi:hypothetical protein
VRDLDDLPRELAAEPVEVLPQLDQVATLKVAELVRRGAVFLSHLLLPLLCCLTRSIMP